MEILQLFFFVLIGLGICWFYFDLLNRYVNLKSRVELLETVLEFMQERNDDV